MPLKTPKPGSVKTAPSDPPDDLDVSLRKMAEEFPDEVAAMRARDVVLCHKCKADRFYGEACSHCGDEFSAHSTIVEHLAKEES